METLVHILARAGKSPKGGPYPFKYWTPVIVHKARMKAKHDVRIEFFHDIDGNLSKCDILIIENKYLALLSNRKEYLVRREQLIDLCLSVSGRAKVIWFDAYDCASMIDAFAIKVVDRYLKMQAFRNLDDYLKKYIFFRPYVDFYTKFERYSQYDRLHSLFEPSLSKELVRELEKKLRISWNFGYCFSYSPFDLNGLVHQADVQSWTPTFTTPRKTRPIDLQARFLSRSRKSWLSLIPAPDNYIQRKLIHSRLSRMSGLTIARNGLLSKDLFLKELENSKAVMSPFGHGEICYRDFETIITGALLLKPDMQHLYTWPQIVEDGKTCLTFRWDFSDLDEKIHLAVTDADLRMTIAEKAQDEYRKFWRNSVDDGFVDYFNDLLKF